LGDRFHAGDQTGPAGRDAKKIGNRVIPKPAS
jgi:hypothetical protein